MNEPGGRWAVLRVTMKCADLLQQDIPGPGPNSYLTTGVFRSFELMIHAHGRIPSSAFLVCSLFSNALGLPQGAYLDFPRLNEWEAAAGRYRGLFTASGVISQDILLR